MDIVCYGYKDIYGYGYKLDTDTTTDANTYMGYIPYPPKNYKGVGWEGMKKIN